MTHKITYRYAEKNGKIITVDVFIDGRPHRMNRADLFKLLR